MHIVTLSTAHNRKNKTVACLSSLHSQTIPDSISLEHVLVDDGSSDCTAECITNLFGDVEVVSGDGNLYWAGGMRYGWQKSVCKKNFDYLFVYNDDALFENYAIQHLVQTSLLFLGEGGSPEHIVAGSFRDSKTGLTSYGGRVRSSKWHPLRFALSDPMPTSFLHVNTLNFNGCLIAREALARVGFLSSYFTHGGADFEYGLKLKKAGGSIILSSSYIGTCDRNYEFDNFIALSPSLISCYKSLCGIKNEPPIQRLRYYVDHGGIFWYFLWIAPYISLPFKFYFSRHKSFSSPD